MVILYIHGYGGHENGSTSQMIRKSRPSDTIIAPSYDYKDPKKAIEQIKEDIYQYEPDIIIASSLGGFYVLQLDYGIPRIVINPATPQDLEAIDSDPDFINELNKQVYNLSDNTMDTVSLFFGTNDQVATHSELLINKYNARPGFSIRKIDMGHEATEDFINHDLAIVINDIEHWTNIYGTERTYYKYMGKR